jgi:hypothetical protein
VFLGCTLFCLSLMKSLIHPKKKKIKIIELWLFPCKLIFHTFIYIYIYICMLFNSFNIVFEFVFKLKIIIKRFILLSYKDSGQPKAGQICSKFLTL